MKGFKKFTLRKNNSGLDPRIISAQRKKANAWMIMSLCTGLSLWFFLIIVRINLLGFSFTNFFISPPTTFKIIMGSHYDFLLAFGLTIFFLALGFSARKNGIITSVIRGFFFFMAIIVQLLGIFSAFFYHKTGGGITYQWMIYSDFFNSTDSQNAILSILSGELVAILVAFLTLFIILTYILKWAVNRLNINKFLPISLLLFTMAFIPISKWYSSNRPWTRMQITNPVLAFIGSSPMFQAQPSLFTMELEETDIQEQISQHKSPVILPLIDSTGSIKNVVILVLESVPAEYLEVYGSKYPVTPNITRFADRSLQIDYAYAHTPSTNRAIFSTLSSLYPKISFNSITKNHTNVATPTISSVLGEKGYRTSFFTSADNRFQDIGKYLKAREFHDIGDYSNIECESSDFNATESGWKFLDGIEDICVGGRFEQWIDENPNQPFFSMLWTVQTHYPYYTTGEIEDFGTENKDKNIYLNALKSGDRLFGDLMDMLDRKGIADSTLVVLMGDHGEAFGTHDQSGHATKIYEENVRIPLIFYHPTLYSGEKLDLITGEVDIAPTIFHHLNIEAPSVWQGQSILHEDFRNNAFFFSPYASFLFGYREGDYKLIYDAGYDIVEIYNVKKDSLELNNISAEMPEFTAKSHRKLASWIQYHNQILEPILKEE